jgi:cyclophilin family peptidyl-prolyl cis-trans isomerase
MSPLDQPRKRVGNPQPKLKKSSKSWIYITIVIVCVIGALLAVVALNPFVSTPRGNPVVVINTTKGIIKVELYQDKAPITVANFIKYVNNGFYSGLIFHRIANLNPKAPTTHIIQAGGFYANGTYKQSPYSPINLETKSDLLHDDGVIAMARTTDRNSATSQFYICDGPQHDLDGQYAVFGKVIDNSSMVVVRLIANVKTTTKTVMGQPMSNWPETDVIINSITLENR